MGAPGETKSPDQSTTGPGRECACVAMNTTWLVENLTYDLMRKLYGRIITSDDGLAWPRCKMCGGSGVDRRP